MLEALSLDLQLHSRLLLRHQARLEVDHETGDERLPWLNRHDPVKPHPTIRQMKRAKTSCFRPLCFYLRPPCGVDLTIEKKFCAAAAAHISACTLRDAHAI